MPVLVTITPHEPRRMVRVVRNGRRFADDGVAGTEVVDQAAETKDGAHAEASDTFLGTKD